MYKVSSPDLRKSLSVGCAELRNRVVLAPMSGVTDVPFRKLAWKHGAGMVVSEMIASEAYLDGEAEMQLKAISGDVPVHMVQLAGREAKWMGLAAKFVEDQGVDIIDINMGCPARRVTTGYSGSALMRDLDHALTLVEAVVNAVDVPVTLKMRLGWDDNSINAPELAKRAEDAGVQLITVHGRTRCQFYKGKANWNAIRAVKDVISVPLIVNGDIKCRDSAASAIAVSGADAVMIGRESYGKPWLPGFVAGLLDDKETKRLAADVNLVLEHHEAMLSFYGIQSGIRQARKHLGWYLDNLRLPNATNVLKKQVMTSFDPIEVHEGIRQLFELHEDVCGLEARAA